MALSFKAFLMSNAYKLELYYYPSCPYCQRVLNKIEELKIKEISYYNTMQLNERREQLIKDTGMSQVPCLYINERPMHESSDIIEWLETHKDTLT